MICLVTPSIIEFLEKCHLKFIFLSSRTLALPHQKPGFLLISTSQSSTPYSKRTGSVRAGERGKKLGIPLALDPQACRRGGGAMKHVSDWVQALAIILTFSSMSFADPAAEHSTRRGSSGDLSLAGLRDGVEPECLKMRGKFAIKFGSGGKDTHTLNVSLTPGLSFNYKTDYKTMQGRVSPNDLSVAATSVKTQEMDDLGNFSWGLFWLAPFYGQRYNWGVPIKLVDHRERLVSDAFFQTLSAMRDLHNISGLLLLAGENILPDPDQPDSEEKSARILECVSQRLGAAKLMISGFGSGYRGGDAAVEVYHDVMDHK
jgi:hypothetical protein